MTGPAASVRVGAGDFWIGRTQFRLYLRQGTAEGELEQIYPEPDPASVPSQATVSGLGAPNPEFRFPEPWPEPWREHAEAAMRQLWGDHQARRLRRCRA